MKPETVEIPVSVLNSIETLDEYLDWLTANNPKMIAELRSSRREDKAGKFKPLRMRRHPDFAKRLRKICGSKVTPDSQSIIDEGRGNF